MDLQTVNSILLGLLATLWATLSTLAWRAYDGYLKWKQEAEQERTLSNNRILTLEHEIANLREWKHAQANDLHLAVLQKIMLESRREKKEFEQAT